MFNKNKYGAAHFQHGPTCLQPTMSYTISNNILTIHESHKVRTLRDMKRLLQDIRLTNADKNYNILQRTDRNIIDEWRVHNLFYDMHVFRLHTRTVDLESPQRWYFRIAYRIFRIFDIHTTRF